MNIKIILSAIVAIFFSVVANAQMAAAMKSPTYTSLDGNIVDGGNVKVTLQKVGDKEIFGTTVSKKGKFTIKGGSTLPYPYKLTIGDKSMIIILSSGDVKVKGDINNLQNAVVEESSSHKEYMVLHNQLAKCKTEMEKEVAMEEFMRDYTHSWISVYLLDVFFAKYPESTQKMRMLMNYVKHFEGAKSYQKIDKVISAVEASDE